MKRIEEKVSQTSPFFSLSRKIINTLFITMVSALSIAQVEKVEPPNWWVGFKESSMQLLIKGPSIGNYTATIDHEYVRLASTHVADSPNYLFLDLEIPQNTPAGTVTILLNGPDDTSLYIPYTLNDRVKQGVEYIGFSSEDAIYLITPDRFSNGNPLNDVVPSLKETQINRKDDYARHGGDIRGMINHLNYIDDMGFTALWPTPLLLNDMPRTSYHGYAITDYYSVDPRFGTLEEYKELSSEAKKYGMKLIMDQVNNHCGMSHWWMDDLPFKNWINYQEGFTEGKEITVTNHRRTVNQDMYASEIDKDLMSDGWFVPSMPDLNQENPFLSNYLIQNSLWWIETLDLGGIRQDTYPYPDKDFMANWAKRIMTEYPKFSIVGEEWSYNPLIVGYWQMGATNKDGYVSNLKSTMDFPLQKLLVQALNEEELWDSGLVKLYEGLANDFHYASPKDIMLFGDNHDMDRLFTQLNKDVVRTQMALAFILTAPRIPQIYYGTEILLDNSASPGDHGLIRTDFPGGWEGDPINAFTGEGLGSAEKEMQQFIKKMLQYRKQAPSIHHGATKHFSPENGVYVLFRYLEEHMSILILNKNDRPVTLNMNRFREMNILGKQFKEVFSEAEVTLSEELSLTKKGVLLLTN
jgi:glycosidase